MDTLLDLKAKEVELVHGVALVNDRAIPFNLAAADLDARVQYLRATDRYGATVDLNDLRTQIAKEPEAKSPACISKPRSGATSRCSRPSISIPASTPSCRPQPVSTISPTPEWQVKVVGLARAAPDPDSGRRSRAQCGHGRPRYRRPQLLRRACGRAEAAVLFRARAQAQVRPGAA